MSTARERSLAAAGSSNLGWFPPEPRWETEIHKYYTDANTDPSEGGFREMITFLPYADFRKSAEVLDNKRLGKQRIEADQILRTLSGTSNRGGWPHHPATRMWRGHFNLLSAYYNEMVREWILRGFAHTPTYGKIFRDTTFNWSRAEEYARHMDVGLWPPWLGNPMLHASHRAALMAKNPEWYSQFNWMEEPIIEYFWPV